ncbi:MAG: phosphodiester glycosidase family protein [Bacteroidota bacterium]
MKRTLAFSLLFLLFTLSSCLVSRDRYEELDRQHKQLEQELNKRNKKLNTYQLNLSAKEDSLVSYKRLVGLMKNPQTAEDSLAIAEMLNQFSNAGEQLTIKSGMMSDTLSVDSDESIRSFIGDLLNAPIANLPFSTQLFDNVFDAYVINLQENDLRFFWQDSSLAPYKSIDKLKLAVEAEDKELLFATNAGMYTPERAPQGLYVEEGKALIPVDTVQSSYGNFYLQPNGIFCIYPNKRSEILTTEQFLAKDLETLYATQSGPMLVINGRIHHKFTKGSKNKYIRSGVGIINSSKIVFIISRKPVNFYDFATLFRDYFGCRNALYLDGNISRMYLPQLKRNQLGGSFGPMIGIVK